MENRPIEITLVKNGKQFYARFALTSPAPTIFPPAQILLAAKTRRDAIKAIETLRAVQNAVDDYGQGGSYAYSLPPRLQHLAEEIPSYARQACLSFATIRFIASANCPRDRMSGNGK
jgi:hypothetical protein